MTDSVLLAVRSSWGAIDPTWPIWAVLIALAWALIALATWALVYGGTRKPTPPRKQPADGLRDMGDAADLIYRDDERRIEWTPGGGWRLK